MLKDLYKYLSMTLVAVFAAACADLSEDSGFPDSEQSRYITFENFNVDTKVTNDDITSQVFAIWIFNESEDSGGNKYNTVDNPYIDGATYRLKYNNGQWRFYDNDEGSYKDIDWGEGKHVFLAFNDVGFGCTLKEDNFDFDNPDDCAFFLPPVDLSASTEEGLNCVKDVICAASSREAEDYSPVQMNFKHVFPSIKFEFHNDSGEEKTIQDFKIYKLRVSTYSNMAVWFNGYVPSWPYSGWSENYQYAVEEDIVVPSGESRVAFGAPVIVIPQGWDDMEPDGVADYMYYIPKVSFTIDEVPYLFNFTNDFYLQEWVVGKLYSYTFNINLLKPIVTIEHVKVEGSLDHSEVKLNLGNLASGQLSRIRNLNVKIYKEEELINEKSFAEVTSSVLTFTDQTYRYLPQGSDYRVDLDYEVLIGDAYESRTSTIGNVSSPAPEYSVTLDVTATESSCTIDKAVVGISDEILSEVGLAAEGSYVLAIQGEGGSTQLGTDISEFDADNSTFMINELTYSGSPTDDGYYVIDVSGLKFDGASPSEVIYDKLTTCENEGNHITYVEGIDYSTVQIGDYFYSDGSFSTDPDGSKEIVGVVFYVGDQHMKDDKTLAASEYAHCNHGLVVASTSAGRGNLVANNWNSYSEWGLKNGCLMSSKGYSYKNMTDRTDNAKLLTGYNNTQALISCVTNNSPYTSDAISALNTINAKKTENYLKYVSPWFFPSIAEFDLLVSTRVNFSNVIDIVNNKLADVEITGVYWTVSEEDTSKGISAVYNTTTASITEGFADGDYAYLPIFAF